MSCACRGRPWHAVLWGAVLPFILLVLCGCNQSSRKSGYVYFRLKADPTTLDPAYVVDVTGGGIAAKLFNGLVRIDAQLRIVPDIAERWEVSPDGRTYIFHLRNDVKFSHGRKVNATDFVYSFSRVLAPENHCPNRWVLEKIAGATDFMEGRAGALRGVEALDAYTLRIILERPFSPFLSLLSMPAAYVVPREKVEELGDSFGFRPVGTGPYVLKEWRHNEELVLEGRSEYYGMPPQVRGLVYRIIPEDLTAVTEFETGNIDILSIPASVFGRYARSSRWKDRIMASEGLNTYYLGLNCEMPPFDSPLVRRAVGHAIDIRKILATLYEGRGRLAYGPVPDNLRRWKMAFSFDYDPQKARTLLEEAGARPPVPVNFYITADQNVVDMAEVIQYYLQRAGFLVRIKQLEWSAFKEALNNGEAHMFWLSWWADYPDPENFLYPLFHSSNIGPAGNRTRFRNSEVDRLIEMGQAATSRRERDKYYSRAEQLVVELAPWIPFWHRNDYIIVQKWVRRAGVYPIYSSDKGTEIIVSEPSGTED